MLLITAANAQQQFVQYINSGAQVTTNMPALVEGVLTKLVDGNFEPGEGQNSAECVTTNAPPAGEKLLITITPTLVGNIATVYLGGANDSLKSDFQERNLSTPGNKLYLVGNTGEVYDCLIYNSLHTNAFKSLYYGFIPCSGWNIKHIVLELTTRMTLCEVQAYSLRNNFQYATLSARNQNNGAQITPSLGSLTSFQKLQPIGYSATDASTNFSSLTLQSTDGGGLALLIDFTAARLTVLINRVVIVGSEDSATSFDGLGYTVWVYDEAWSVWAQCDQITPSVQGSSTLSGTFASINCKDVGSHKIEIRKADPTHGNKLTLHSIAVFTKSFDFCPQNLFQETLQSFTVSQVTLNQIEYNIVMLNTDLNSELGYACTLQRTLTVTSPSGISTPFITLGANPNLPSLKVDFSAWSIAESTMTLEYKVGRAGSPLKTYSITVTKLNHCVVQTLTPSGVISDQTLILGGQEKEVDLISFTQTPNCGYSLTYSTSSLPFFVMLFPSSAKIRISSAYVGMQAGTYPILIPVAAGGSDLFTISFSVKLVNCDPSIYINPGYIEIKVSRGSSVSFPIMTTAQPAECGTYTITLPQAMPNQLTYVIANNYITFQSQLSSTVKSDSVQFKVKNDLYWFVSEFVNNANLVVTECVLTSIQTTQPSAISYLIKAPQITIQLLSNLTQQPNCGFPLSASIQGQAPSFVSIDLTDKTTMVISGSNLNEANTYTVTVVAIANVQTNVTGILNIQVVGIDCTPKNFGATPSTLAMTNLDSNKTVQIYYGVTPASCGTYTYSISLQPFQNIPVTISQTGLLTVPSVPQPFVKAIDQGQVMIKQDTAPYLSSVVPFSIDHTQCLITSISASTQLPSSIVFFIDGPTKKIDLPSYSQFPNCDFNQKQIVDDNKNYDASMLQYDLTTSKIIISPTQPSQVQTYLVQTKMSYKEQPAVFNMQKTELKVVSVKCITMPQQTYTIKNAPFKQTWTLDSTNAIQKSANFENTMIKSEVTNASGSLPAWFGFDAATQTFYISSSNRSDAGTYKFSVKLTSPFHDGWTCMVPMEIVMIAESTNNSAVPKLNKLVFERELTKTFTVKPGDTLSYILPAPTYLVLEKNLKPSDITMTVQAPSFIIFQPSSRLLLSTRAFKATDSAVKIKLSLSDPSGLSGSFEIVVSVEQPKTQTLTEKSADNKAAVQAELKSLIDKTADSKASDGTKPSSPQLETTDRPGNLTDTSTEQMSTNSLKDAQLIAIEEQKQALANKIDKVSSWDGWKVLMQQFDQQVKQAMTVPGQIPIRQPELSVKSLSSTGLLTIKSSLPLQVPKDQSGRRLKEKRPMKLDLIRSEQKYINSTSNDFTWNITDFKPTQVQLQLNFTAAGNISDGDQPDVLIVRIQDLTQFVGQNGQLASTLFIATQLPRQIQLGSTEEMVAQAASSAGSGAKSVVIGNLILNSLMSASLNQLWSMVEAQQMVVMMPMFCVQIPPMPAVVLQKFLEIANFDILPVDRIWQAIFYMPASYPLEARYQAVGIETTQFVANMGSLFIICLLISLLVITTALLTLCTSLKPARYAQNYLRKIAFWKLPLQVFLESCMIVCLCALLTVQHPNWDSLGQKIDTLFGYGMGILFICLFFTVLLIMYLFKLPDEVQKKTAHDKFSPLYDDLDMDNRWITFFRFAFMVRRIIIAVAIVLVDKLVFQLFLGYFQSTLMIITVGNLTPFYDKSKWIKELTNEMIILSSLYFVMCFSPLVPDLEAQDLMGYGFCLMMGIHCAVNILIMLGTSIIQTIGSFKRYLFLRKHKKLRDAKRDWTHKENNKRVAREFMKRRCTLYLDADVLEECELDDFIENAEFVWEEQEQQDRTLTTIVEEQEHPSPREQINSQSPDPEKLKERQVEEEEEEKIPSTQNPSKNVTMQSAWDNALGTEQRTDDSWDREEPDLRNFAKQIVHARHAKHDSKTPLFVQEPNVTQIAVSQPRDENQTKEELELSDEELKDNITFAYPERRESQDQSLQRFGQIVSEKLDLNHIQVIRESSKYGLQEINKHITGSLLNLRPIDLIKPVEQADSTKKKKQVKKKREQNDELNKDKLSKPNPKEWGLQTKSALHLSSITKAKRR